MFSWGYLQSWVRLRLYFRTLTPIAIPVTLRVGRLLLMPPSIVDRLLARLYRKALEANHKVSLHSLGALGTNTRIDNRVFIWGWANCFIGSNVQINGYTFLYAGGGITVGDNSMIASNVVISSVTHPVAACNRHHSILEPVSIGRNVWLCAGCTILPGVSIGDNSIIAAGAVVNRDIPPNVIAAGIPAVIKKPLL